MRKDGSNRKAYKAPKLTRYGDVASLTASGTKSVIETNTTPAQPNKRPPP